jgi:hypothetical protein
MSHSEMGLRCTGLDGAGLRGEKNTPIIREVRRTGNLKDRLGESVSRLHGSDDDARGGNINVFQGRGMLDELQ